MMIKIEKDKNSILKVMLFFIMISLYFQRFYFEIGFALKPFMLVLFFIITGFFVLKIKLIQKIFYYEMGFLFFWLFSITRGSFSLYKIQYFRLVLGFIIVLILYIFSFNIIRLMKTKDIYKIIYFTGLVFLISSLVLFVAGDMINYSGAEVDKGITRLIGTIIDPNIFVIFFSLIYGVSLHKSINKERKYYLTLFLSVVSLFLTFSRGGLLGFIFFTCLYIIKYKMINIKFIFRIIFFSLIVILIFVFLINLYQIDINSIISKRIRDFSGSGRLRIWNNALKLFKQNPVFGIGLYNFLSYNSEMFNDYHHVHNIYLEIIVENGILGSTLFFSFLLLFIIDKPRNKEAKLIKLIIYFQLFLLLFLSGIINEFVYFTFAIYKGLNLKETTKLSGGLNEIRSVNVNNEQR